VAGGAPPDFDHLDPGGQPDLREEVPVNIVFVGYDRDQISSSRFRRTLADSYEPVVRSRLWYGIEEQIGITYTYDYDLHFADDAYQDRFFGTLKRLSRPAPLTQLQRDYNRQDNNVRTVGRNHHISAPSVERWLAFNPPRGVDTRRNTVYLINGWQRPDFEFHVYTKTNEPDPDTGYNFGVRRESRKMVAWGGTTAADEENGLGDTRRVWFHDLSAGPEQWGGSWNVDDADVDGDGVADYRIPVAWEYDDDGYRRPSELTEDLAKLTRYVAVDLLFTTSPLYPVELPTRQIPESIDLDSNTYEAWPGVDASRDYITARLLRSELRPLLRRNVVSYDSQDLPFRGAAERCYRGWLANRPCFPRLEYPAFANLFLQNAFELERTQDDRGRVDYELAIFNYAVGGRQYSPPLLGFADDDWRDGDQTFVFAFISPQLTALGYGLTTTLIHEIGHHLGLSHPHDGYDSEDGVDFGPVGDFYFVWAGDESNSMMSYIDLNWDFSQFDLDNMNRFRAAASVEGANRLAARALAGPRPGRAYAELRRADRLVGETEQAFEGHRYRQAMMSADQAHEAAVRAARLAGVPVDRFEDEAQVANRAARPAAEVEDPNEFIDTLDPDGPRAQP